MTARTAERTSSSVSQNGFRCKELIEDYDESFQPANRCRNALMKRIYRVVSQCHLYSRARWSSDLLYTVHYTVEREKINGDDSIAQQEQLIEFATICVRS